AAEGLRDVRRDEQRLIGDRADPVRRGSRRLLESLLGLGPLRHAARLVLQGLLLKFTDLEQVLRGVLHLLREFVLLPVLEVLAHLIDALSKPLEPLARGFRPLPGLLALSLVEGLRRFLEILLRFRRTGLLGEAFRLLGRLSIHGAELRRERVERGLLLRAHLPDLLFGRRQRLRILRALRAGERVVQGHLAPLHVRGALRCRLELLLHADLLQHLDRPLQVLHDLFLIHLHVLKRAFHVLGRKRLQRLLEPLDGVAKRLVLDLAQYLLELLDLLYEFRVQGARGRELLRVLAQLLRHLVDLVAERLLALDGLLGLLLFLPRHLAGAAQIARQFLGLLLQLARLLEYVLKGRDRLVPLLRHRREDLRGRGEAER